MVAHMNAINRLEFGNSSTNIPLIWWRIPHNITLNLIYQLIDYYLNFFMNYFPTNYSLNKLIVYYFESKVLFWNYFGPQKQRKERHTINCWSRTLLYGKYFVIHFLKQMKNLTISVGFRPDIIPLLSVEGIVLTSISISKSFCLSIIGGSGGVSSGGAMHFQAHDIAPWTIIGIPPNTFSDTQTTIYICVSVFNQ